MITRKIKNKIDQLTISGTLSSPNYSAIAIMKIFCTLLVISAVLLHMLPAGAQAYPEKPIRVVLAGPAGGTPDLVARMLAPGMSALLGQQLVMDNRSGAGGLIGAQFAARAAPDGYVLFLAGASFTILPHLRKEPTYDPVKDFAPIGQIANGPQLLVAHPSVPFSTVKALIAYAKANPGKLNYASAGNGSPFHLATELFKSMAGVNMTHVPYKETTTAVTGLISGQVDLSFATIPTVLQHIKSGRLRLLGISSAKRSALLPDVPTISEGGVPGYEWGGWYGLFAPAKTPRPIITRLNEVLIKVLHTPEIKSQFDAQGADVIAGSPEEFAAFMVKEFERDVKAVKLSGATVD